MEEASEGMEAHQKRQAEKTGGTLANQGEQDSPATAPSEKKLGVLERLKRLSPFGNKKEEPKTPTIPPATLPSSDVVPISPPDKTAVPETPAISESPIAPVSEAPKPPVPPIIPNPGQTPAEAIPAASPPTASPEASNILQFPGSKPAGEQAVTPAQPDSTGIPTAPKEEAA